MSRFQRLFNKIKSEEWRSMPRLPSVTALWYIENGSRGVYLDQIEWLLTSREMGVATAELPFRLYGS